MEDGRLAVNQRCKNDNGKAKMHGYKTSETYGLALAMTKITELWDFDSHRLFFMLL